MVVTLITAVSARPSREDERSEPTMSSTLHHDGVAPEEPNLRPGRVVVGISNRDESYDRSLLAAEAWAARRQLDVELVVGLGRGDRTSAEGADDRARLVRSEIGAAADHLALQLEPAQRVHTSISELSGVDALLAASGGAGVVVLQRRRLGPLARIRAGSTSALVAARAACPVLIVHPDDPAPASEVTGPGILVGVDARGHAAHAIAEAFAEASWRDVPLTAVLASEPPGPTFVPPGPSETEFLHASAAAELAEQLAGHREQYPDVEVHQSVLWGRAAPVLADLSVRYELLVVARHTEGHRGKRNLGSESRRLLEEAHCSVLITPTSRPTPVARHRHAAMTSTPPPTSP